MLYKKSSPTCLRLASGAWALAGFSNLNDGDAGLFDFLEVGRVAIGVGDQDVDLLNVDIKSNLVKPDEYLDFPHIAPDNIEKNTGKLLSFKTIREDEVISPKHYFYAGQIIYSKIRPNLSKLVLVDFNGLCSADMYPLESDVFNHYFLKYIMLSRYFVKKASTAGSRSVLPKINQSELGMIPIPICSLAEQTQIVAILESKLTACDQLAAELAKQLKQADLLKQAVLKAAFSGGLLDK